MTGPLATVAITTHNRKDELRRAIASALKQDAPLEILVIDDASSDGTSEMVRTEFPQVRLDRTEQNLGLIEQRNRAARLASAAIVVSIDDDAVFQSTATVRDTLEQFRDPRVAVVAIPYVDVHHSPEVHQKAPDDRLWETGEYRGTAHAVRRDIFLRLGGYRGHLFRQGEEGDFAIRVINSGASIILGNAQPILHYESARRDLQKIMFYTARNAVLFAWHNTPGPILPMHLLANTLATLRAGTTWGTLSSALRGLAAGLAATLGHWRERKPVSYRGFLKYRRLRGRGPRPLGRAV